LKLMGHSGTVPSAFKPEDIPAALSRLKQAASQADASPEDEGKTANQDEDEDEPVSLRNRALPLIDLMEAADKAQVHIMWES
ncbi:MAG: DUF1840 domain-containing protein, partial [Gammaproteobacteria bacterium]